MDNIKRLNIDKALKIYNKRIEAYCLEKGKKFKRIWLKDLALIVLHDLEICDARKHQILSRWNKGSSFEKLNDIYIDRILAALGVSYDVLVQRFS